MRPFLLTAALLFVALSGSADEVKKVGAGKVEVGKPAPDFNLPATGVAAALPDKKGAKTVSLKDFEGKKNVVLFFFPKAMTPGCTRQCKGFTALNAEFAKVDTVPIGISTDSLDLQEKFTQKDSLTVPLFADADKETARAYGVLNPARGMANRATFVIDKKGIVRKIYPTANPDNNPAEVLDFVKKNLADR